MSTKCTSVHKTSACCTHSSSSNMPNQARIHEDCRKIICLVCFQKDTKNAREIEGELLKRVKKHFLINYDADDSHLPKAVCGRCNKLLLQVEKFQKLFMFLYV